MTDAGLLAFGCVVTFVAVAGAYVYVRECFEAGPREVDRVDRGLPAPRDLKRAT